MSDVAILILAAGRGTRFGRQPKLLALHAGKPLVRHVAETALVSGCGPVFVVTGHRRDEVRRALADLPVALAENPDYRHGLSTSLRAGFAALPPQVEAFVVMLGDMPFVEASTLCALVEFWRSHADLAAVVPSYRGRRGNPVLLGRRLGAEIMALDGDQGAWPMLKERGDVRIIPVEDSGILLDIDTPDALARGGEPF